MENLKKDNKPAKPNEKKDPNEHEIEKTDREKVQEINADNDNGFVSPATEGSSNKGQGPAGEDL